MTNNIIVHCLQFLAKIGISFSTSNEKNWKKKCLEIMHYSYKSHDYRINKFNLKKIQKEKKY